MYLENYHKSKKNINICPLVLRAIENFSSKISKHNNKKTEKINYKNIKKIITQKKFRKKKKKKF